MDPTTMKPGGRLAIVLAVLATGACTPPNLGSRPLPVETARLDSAKSLAGASATAQWPADDWWRRYGDAQLDGLVEEALANSPTVAEAAARVRAARGVMQQAGATGLPQLEANGSAGAKKQSYNNGIPPDFVPKGWNSDGDISLGANFDLDLWGRNKALLAAATSDLAASEVDVHQAKVILATNVVSSYADLAQLYAERDVLEQAASVRAKSAALATQRFNGGLDNRGSSDLARSQQARAAGELEANAEEIALRRHALAALLGAGPDRGLAIARPDFSTFTPIAVPGDAGIALAGRRPDIVAARLRVEAQGRRIDAAKAAFLPDISLSGLIGMMSLGLDNLFDSGSSYGDAHAAISLPIFDGGTRRGNYTQARGGYDQLVAQYDETVIAALQQVADALASRASVERQLVESDHAYAAAKSAAEVAMLRYRGGLSTYIDALTAQSTMLDAQRATIDNRARLVSLDVALVRALGGGFADPIQTQTSRSAQP